MKQESGNASNNIQAGRDVIIGLTYTDVRQIALDIFQANFYKLSETASEKALERAQELIDEFLKRFFEEIPHLTEKLKEPSIQYSIFNAQKEYAKTGDKELETQLLNLLLARINSDERSLKQIVLDEALLVLPKLTSNQINLLTLIFSAYNLNHGGINSIESFENFFINNVVKFFPSDISNYSFFTHLQYCGCYVAEEGIPAYVTLEEDFAFRFKGLFTNGFSEIEFQKETNNIAIESLGDFIIPHLRNSQLYQFNSLNSEVFKKNLNKLNLSLEMTHLLYALWDKTTMSKKQINEVVSKIDTKANFISSAWRMYKISLMRLTSVGYAIAIANFNDKNDQNIDFGNFI